MEEVGKKMSDCTIATRGENIGDPLQLVFDAKLAPNVICYIWLPQEKSRLHSITRRAIYNSHQMMHT